MKTWSNFSTTSLTRLSEFNPITGFTAAKFTSYIVCHCGQRLTASFCWSELWRLCFVNRVCLSTTHKRERERTFDDSIAYDFFSFMCNARACV
jgi:hypothetical protein